MLTSPKSLQHLGLAGVPAGRMGLKTYSPGTARLRSPTSEAWSSSAEGANHSGSSGHLPQNEWRHRTWSSTWSSRSYAATQYSSRDTPHTGDWKHLPGSERLPDPAFEPEIYQNSEAFYYPSAMNEPQRPSHAFHEHSATSQRHNNPRNKTNVVKPVYGPDSEGNRRMKHPVGSVLDSRTGLATLRNDYSTDDQVMMLNSIRSPTEHEPGLLDTYPHQLVANDLQSRYLPLVGRSFANLQSSLDLFLPKLTLYGQSQQFLYDLDKPQPAVNLLDVCETWRGLSTVDAETIMTWEKTLQEEILQRLAPRLEYLIQRPHCTGPQNPDSLLIDEEVRISKADFLLEFAERLRRLRRSNAIFPSRIALYKAIELFVVTHHIFVPDEMESNSIWITFKHQHLHKVDVQWYPPTLVLENFSLLALEGETYHLRPIIHFDSASFDLADEADLTVRYSTDRDWLVYDDASGFFSGKAPYVNEAYPSLSWNPRCAYGIWLPMTLKAKLSYRFTDRIQFEQVLRARVEILIIPSVAQDADNVIRGTQSPTTQRSYSVGIPEVDTIHKSGHFSNETRIHNNRSILNTACESDQESCVKILPHRKDPGGSPFPDDNSLEANASLSMPESFSKPQPIRANISCGSLKVGRKVQKPNTKHHSSRPRMPIKRRKPIRVTKTWFADTYDRTTAASKLRDEKIDATRDSKVSGLFDSDEKITMSLLGGLPGSTSLDDTTGGPLHSDVWKACKSKLQPHVSDDEDISFDAMTNVVERSENEPSSVRTVLRLTAPLSDVGDRSSLSPTSSLYDGSDRNSSLFQTRSSNELVSLRGRSDMDELDSVTSNSTVLSQPVSEQRARSLARAGSVIRESAPPRQAKAAVSSSILTLPLDRYSRRMISIEDTFHADGSNVQAENSAVALITSVQSGTNDREIAPLTGRSSGDIPSLRDVGKIALETAITAAPLDGSTDARDVREIRRAIFEMELQKLDHEGSTTSDKLGGLPRYHNSSD